MKALHLLLATARGCAHGVKPIPSLTHRAFIRPPYKPPAQAGGSVCETAALDAPPCHRPLIIYPIEYCIFTHVNIVQQLVSEE